MKYLVLMIIGLMCLPNTSTAQKGYKFLDLAFGSSIKSYELELSYDVVGKYHSAQELFAEYAQNFNSETEYKSYLVGYAYKPLIGRNKNFSANMRLALSLGSDKDNFLAGLGAGVEFNFTLPNSSVLFLRQKNQAMIADFEDANWKIALLMGLKIPLTPQ